MSNLEIISKQIMRPRSKILVLREGYTHMQAEIWVNQVQTWVHAHGTYGIQYWSALQKALLETQERAKDADPLKREEVEQQVDGGDP